MRAIAPERCGKANRAHGALLQRSFDSWLL